VGSGVALRKGKLKGDSGYRLEPGKICSAEAEPHPNLDSAEKIRRRLTTNFPVICF
jgi:hypothetical protein